MEINSLFATLRDTSAPAARVAALVDGIQSRLQYAVGNRDLGEVQQLAEQLNAVKDNLALAVAGTDEERAQAMAGYSTENAQSAAPVAEPQMRASEAERDVHRTAVHPRNEHQPREPATERDSARGTQAPNPTMHGAPTVQEREHADRPASQTQKDDAKKK